MAEAAARMSWPWWVFLLAALLGVVLGVAVELVRGRFHVKTRGQRR